MKTERLRKPQDRYPVVDGMVHAICHVAVRVRGQLFDRPAVFIQHPEHFAPCEDCRVYSDLDLFRREQALRSFAGDYVYVRCEMNCYWCYSKIDPHHRAYHRQGIWYPWVAQRATPGSGLPLWLPWLPPRR